MQTYLGAAKSLLSNATILNKQARSIERVFQEERRTLRALNGTFNSYRETLVRVSSTCLVQFDCNRYSVPCAYANQLVSIRVYASVLDIFSQNEKVACHMRQFSRSQVFFDPWHYVPLLERKPGALRNVAPFKEWVLPRAIAKVKEALLKRLGGDRQCVAVLSAIKEHGMEAVEVACDLALSDHTLSSDVILNTVCRLREHPKPQAIETPVQLTLGQEPLANCQQYDALLKEVSHAIA